MFWDAATSGNISIYVDQPVFALAWSPNDTYVGSRTGLTLLVNPLSGMVEPLEGRDPRWGRMVTIEPSYDANDIESSRNAHRL